jgi:hypothetical protein
MNTRYFTTLHAWCHKSAEMKVIYAAAVQCESFPCVSNRDEFGGRVTERRSDGETYGGKHA